MDRKLIELVEANEILYDKSSKEFKDTNKKQVIWEEIGKSLNITAEHVQRRWKILVDRFCKERREIILSENTATFPYFNQMQFLDPYDRSKNFAEVNKEMEMEETSPLSPSYSNPSPFLSNIFVEVEDDAYRRTDILATTSTSSSSATTPQRPRLESLTSSNVDEAIMSVAAFIKNMPAMDADIAFGQYVGLELKTLKNKKKALAKAKICQMFLELNSD